MAGSQDLPRRDFLAYLSGGVGGMLFLGESAQAGASTPAGPAGASPAVADVRSFGALGDGLTDDSEAIQRAAAATPIGGILLFPAGLFVVSRTIHMPPSITVAGTGIGNPTETGISALTLMESLFKWEDGTATGVCVRDLSIAGPISTGGGDLDADELGACALDFGKGGANISLSRLGVSGFTNAIVFRGQQSVRIDDVTTSSSGAHGLAIIDSIWFTITGGLYSNTTYPTDSGANIYLRGTQNGPGISNIRFIGVTVDEAIGNAPSLYIRNGRDISFESGLVYVYEGEIGILIGDGDSDPPSDITIANTVVTPWGVHAAANTIKIMPGTRDTTLSNVKTRIPNGGGDIDDQGTGTVSINVNQSGVIA